MGLFSIVSEIADDCLDIDVGVLQQGALGCSLGIETHGLRLVGPLCFQEVIHKCRGTRADISRNTDKWTGDLLLINIRFGEVIKEVHYTLYTID